MLPSSKQNCMPLPVRLCGLLLLITGSLSAYQQRFTKLTVRDGLPHNSIYGLTLDHRGFLWIGTENGLARFDGYSFKAFQHNPFNPNSLSDSSVGQMLEDDGGHLWIGTWGGGLNRFSTRGGENREYRHDPAQQNSLPGNRIQTLFRDAKGRIWVGTYENGFGIFDPTSEEWRNFRHQPQNPASLPHDRVWMIRPGKAGIFWLATSRGLVRFDAQQQRFQTFLPEGSEPESAPSAVIRNFWIQDHNTIWAGTRGGLFRFTPSTQTFQRHWLPGEKGHSASTFDIRTIYADSRGQLWVGSLGAGLIKLDLQSGKSTRFNHHPRDSNSLSDNNIEVLLEDPAGNLWIGTYGGLNKLNLKQAKFGHQRHMEGQANSISSDAVGALYQDPQKNLWVGTFGGGLNKKPAGGGPVTVFNTANTKGLTSDIIRVIVPAQNQQLWLGTYYGGLLLFHMQNHSIRAFRHQKDDPTSLSSDRVRTLLEEPDGGLWVGTDDGLNHLQHSSTAFTSPNNHELLAAQMGRPHVYTLCKTDTHTLWAGTNRGLFRYNRERQEITRFANESKNPASLSHNRVFALYVDSQKRLWVGTNCGLNLADPQKGTFKSFFIENGLPSNSIKAITGDQNGILWLATGNGVSKFDPTSSQFFNYDMFDGLQESGFNWGAVHRSEQGEIFFGGRNGYNHFFPHQLQKGSRHPPVVITAVSTGLGKHLRQRPPQQAGTLDIRHWENAISFEFSVLDFTAPPKNRYRYRLEGFEDEWTVAAKNRRATYTNLAPGKYRFRLSGANGDGIWNEHGAMQTLRVIPAPWLTAWAKASYLVSLLGALWFFYRWRIRKHHERESSLEREVTSRTQELQATNREMAVVNNELTTLNQIVHMLNKETRLAPLMTALLEGGLKFFSNAQKGFCLNYDYPSKRFKFSAVAGYEISQFENFTLTFEEAVNRYTTGKEKLQEGVYLIRSLEKLRRHDTPSGISASASLLAMTLPFEGRNEAFLIFENLEDPNAFQNSDILKLKAFRDHAITAVAKARLVTELTQTAENLRETRNKLLEAAHQAGMAEIAGNVLHNVGNFLNSINTSAEVIRSLGGAPAFRLLHKIGRLIDENQADLSEYLTQDPRGKQIPRALLEISTNLQETYRDFQGEVKGLKTHVHHLREIVRAEKSYATNRGKRVTTQADLESCLREVLAWYGNSLEIQGILLHQRFEPLPKLPLPQIKLKRVLQNIFDHTLENAENGEARHLECRGWQAPGRGVFFTLFDPAGKWDEQQGKAVFRQGLGTHTKMHYSAQVMQELGGQIEFRAAPKGPGTVVSLFFPVAETMARKAIV